MNITIDIGYLTLQSLSQVSQESEGQIIRVRMASRLTYWIV